MSADAKCNFAKLKFEQLLHEKYFVKTCFSKVYESYSSKQKLQDLLLKTKCNNEKIKKLCS